MLFAGFPLLLSEAVNTGVPIVLPARDIGEIRDQPELVAMRKKIDGDIVEKHGSVGDSKLEQPEHTFAQKDRERCGE
jgi:hypothetical protein